MPILLGAPSTGQPAWVGTLAVIGVTILPLVSPTVLRIARKGLRPRKCKTCYGVGYDLCTICNGRGKQGGVFTTRELLECVFCGGRGRQLCGRCDGVGLANSWLYQPAKKGGWGPRGS